MAEERFLPSDGTLLLEVGRLDDVCPTCEVSLAKRPGRKTRCPRCGAFIFVRTRALDRKRVLVTEEQGALLEQEWGRLQDARLAIWVDKAVLEQLRPSLERQLGRAPSDFELVEVYLTREMAERRRACQWGLYVSTRLSIAMLREREKRFDEALSGYLEVFYISGNGPVNRGTIVGKDGSRRVGIGPDFSGKMTSPASGQVSLVSAVATALCLDDTRLKALFLKIATQVQEDLKTPVAPVLAWDELYNALHHARARIESSFPQWRLCGLRNKQC